MKFIKKLLLLNTFSLFTFAAYATVNPFVTEKNIDEINTIKNNKNNLEVEQSFSQGGNEYTVFKDLKAYIGHNRKIPKKFGENSSFSFKDDASQINVLGNGRKILLDKGVFQIYEDQKVQKNFQMSTNKNINNNSLENKVAYNNKTKKFGVITGKAIVKINPSKEISLPDASFQIEKSYKQMGLYIIKLPEDISLKDAITKFENANPNAKTITNNEESSEDSGFIVKIEVLENFKTAM